MKVVPDNINLFHLIIRYFDTFWIFILIQFNSWRRYLPARAAGSVPCVRPCVTNS
jgi:hypothetical protein